MPSLTPEDRERLIGPVKGMNCPRCGEEVRRNYCRQCDDFFFVCGCQKTPEELHEGHRTY
jgi:hypothetical protein